MKIDFPGAPVDYDCLVLHWPNTPEWRAVLTGLVYSLTRGRTWDERTSTVKDAQAAGWEIFYKNFPWQSCAGDELPTDNDTVTNITAGGGGEGDSETMGWYVTDVTIENGKLVLHYGPCCTKGVDGALSASTDPETHNPYDDVVDPDTGQPYVAYPCGKAAAMVNAVWAAWTALVNNWDDPTGVIGDVKTSLPEASFNTLYIWDAYLQLLVAMAADEIDPLDMENIWDVDNLLDDQRRQTWICRLADRVSEGATATEADIDFLRSVGKGLYSVSAGTALTWIMNAIGSGDLKAIGTAGSSQNADCTCPDLHPEPPFYTIPDGMTWAYLIDFTTGENGFTYTNGADAGYTAGTGFWCDVHKDTLGGGVNWAMMRLTRNADATGSNRKLHYISVHSSTLPTGATHMRNPLNMQIGGTTFAGWSNMPLQSVYSAEVTAGVAWANGTAFNAFTTVTFDTGSDEMGRHTVDKMVLAGTGTPPYGDLTNLLA